MGGTSNSLWPDRPSFSTWDQVRADVERLASDLIDKLRADELRKELTGVQALCLGYEKESDVEVQRRLFSNLRGDL